ncbi:MAG: multicopper oxidase domain-containing protein [Kiritimatiellae bacterium]|nr:multicopper oxidase domain-containing protein [Kiritimatiellia bacterium]
MTTTKTYRAIGKGASRALLLTALTLCRTAGAQMGDTHMITGIAGPNISLTAKEGHVSTADGNSVHFWGLAEGAALAQYPAPTIIVSQGTTLTITLNNELPMPVSLVFPGQAGVTATGGSPGAIAQEAAPAGSVTYTFTVNEPGTYTYHSGTRPDLQIEMGIVGALIVRPVVGAEVMTMQAYAHPDTAFDHEFLFLLSEMDDQIHSLVEQGRLSEVNTAKRWPVYWFMNGRTGPDTMVVTNAPWLPSQPYDCMPMFHPGERVLLRVIGGGSDPHPLHHHGNNSTVVARNGRMLTSAPAAGPDLGESVFTIPSAPGETVDAIFTWTGEKLGWDIYGHKPEDPLEPFEYAPDHGKPFPVSLPVNERLTFGQHYSGSPFLGAPGSLPPGQGGFNPMNGYAFMWHSHNEKEIVNNNLFPGGMLTMAMIAPYPSTNMVMQMQNP